ncbi:hypothetical protein BDR26DRAFT_865751 [Obelidium mucronatum]|nr:hypothetical protein BDR26DRAFT_865751 [Obelidium mucronatum]
MRLKPRQQFLALALLATLPLLYFFLGRNIGEKPVEAQVDAAKHQVTSTQRVVVSLTSFPGRLHRINQTIHSLGMQTLRPDRIVLAIPKDGVVRFKNNSETSTLNSADADLLRDLQRRFPFLFVHKTTDYGSATKLLGALELETDPDTIIVTVDDDTIYHPSTVHALVSALEAQKHSPSRIKGPVCFVCQYWPKWWFAVLRQQQPGMCKGFLNAYAGAAYRVSHFTTLFEAGGDDGETALKHAFNHSSWPGVPERECRLHDDVWLSGVLFKTSRGLIRPHVISPGFDSIIGEMGNTQFSINSVKNTEKEYRDPCLKFFDYLQ